MVLESVVVDVLNRFLGDYVVNLDSSQLTLGIWGGDVSLKNLEIKENALSQLDVPFKVKAGHIHKLNLAIPWTNLYTQPVEAVLEGIYLLIVPTASIKYDAEKEEKQILEARQRELRRIEETKQKMADTQNPQEKQDTFFEKLVTKIIKNLQVKISSIHIRYEDDITSHENPLSFGISLENLSLQTADQYWNPCLYDEDAKLFYKLIRLDNFCAYWNVKSQLFYHGDYHDSLRMLEDGIASKNVTPEGYNFVFRPISAKAKLKMNPRAEPDFSSPKMDLDVKLDDIAIELNKPQYFSVMELLESIDMMTQNLPYRKYRPDEPVHNHAKKWWGYAIRGILEVNIRPSMRMWSWKYIKQHRLKVKRYKHLYKKKISSKKPGAEILIPLEEFEKTLDVFNITLARQQAEVEVKKSGFGVHKLVSEFSDESSKGWFSWIWDWSGPSEARPEVRSGSLEELMTPEEKAKLYAAIGYSETAVDPSLPKSYQSMKLVVTLQSMSICIREKPKKPELIRFVLGKMNTEVVQRPGAQSIRFGAIIDSFKVTGRSNKNECPLLLSSMGESSSLLTILFETNPLDGTCDQKCIVEAQPMEIIYDAMTVNSLMEFFRPPEKVHFSQLTSVTLMKLEEFREKTAAGVLYVIETQKVLDLRINMKASYIIIPQYGSLRQGSSNILLLDLGHLKMISKSRSELSDIRTGWTNIEEIMSRAYDTFDIQLSSVQLLYSKVGENWKEARKLTHSSQHILDPMHLKVEFCKAMIVTDARMPKFKLCGQLPLLSLRISDKKLRGILELIESIPRFSSLHGASTQQRFSQVQMTPPLAATQVSQRGLPCLELSKIMESDEEEFFDAPTSPVNESPKSEAFPLFSTQKCGISHGKFQRKESMKNLTEFKIRFELPEVIIQLCQFTIEDFEQPVMELNIIGLGTEIQFKTFDMSISAFLKEICLKCPEYLDEENKTVHIITTLDNTIDDLLTMEYVKTDISGARHASAYSNIEQKLKVNFSSLDVHLHTEALLNTMNYLSNLLPQVEKKAFMEDQIVESAEKMEILKKIASKKYKHEDIIHFQVFAELESLRFFIREQKRKISEIKIEGLDSQVIMRQSATEIKAKLKNITILDSDEMAVYKKAVYITGREVFTFHLISYVGATAGAAYTNMNIVDSHIYLTVGCIQVVFVNKFLSSVLAFVDNFQAAKKAVTEATVQAAGKAATGVKELAQRSYRMALDINVKAPIVVIPQSPVSQNVLVVDFGLITIKNKFYMSSKMKYNPPPIIDFIMIKLSEMKLYRSQFISNSLQEVLELLQPLNLEVDVERNLSSEWYHDVPDIKITGNLKPMQLILSQEDITTVLRTLHENVWDSYVDDDSSSVFKDQTSPTGFAKNVTQRSKTTVVTAAVVEVHPKQEKAKTTLSMNFRIDSLTLILYSGTTEEFFPLQKRNALLILAEFKLDQILSTVRLSTDSSIFASFILKNCGLEDKRVHVQKATPRMMGMTIGYETKDMVDVTYKHNRDGAVIDAVIQEIYLCASVEFLQTVADIFLQANEKSAAARRLIQSLPTKDQGSIQVVPKLDINVMVRNPEIIFVADLTRSDAPSLVVTTQCELSVRNTPEVQKITAIIKALQVQACPFLQGEKDGNITTVLQPCDFFFQNIQAGTDPQVIDMSIKSLTLKVSPIIINTVITITEALYPDSNTLEKAASSTRLNLWEKMDTKKLKMWFLEESNESDVAETVPELIPKGEMMKVTVESVFIVLEAGIGHRTVPMLLAKSSLLGQAKNFRSLIHFHCKLQLEVHYFNEMFGVWEPLLEPVEIEDTEDFRPWNLGIKMKKKSKRAIVDSDSEEENYKVPEYKTSITFFSKDQLNITLSKCGLIMMNNLGQAFANAASGSKDIYTKDQAPFIVINSLGLTISISTSDHFQIVGAPRVKAFELKNEETIDLDYVRSSDSDQFTAMTSLSSKLFFILITPYNHSTADRIPLTKVGRFLYTVRHRESGVERSVVCQIDTVEGSKMVTMRSPLQIRNHFSIPLNIFEEDTFLGTALPDNEFNIPLTAYRSVLFLKPGGENYEKCEAITFEEIINNSGVLIQKKCQILHEENTSFIINVVSVEDSLSSLSVYSNDGWDLPYVIHLWPPILLRNLLPYEMAYSLEGSGHDLLNLEEGCSAQLYTAELDQARIHLELLDYLDRDWKSDYEVKSEQSDISFITFTSITELETTELDIAIHITYNTGQTVVAFHSPYWMVNKTGRLLQYKADGIHRKHPPDYRKPILFSFQPKNFFNNNKVQLLVTDSDLSDPFSIDTVGSHGSVKCRKQKIEYQVGITIDLSSFNLTRIVTFTPFFMITNKSNYQVKVSEEGSGKWMDVGLEQCIPFWPASAANKLLIQVENSEGLIKKLNFTKQENCILLHLGNKLGGIIVDVNVAEHSTVITFTVYHDGAAPFLLINHTNNEVIEYRQSSRSELEDCLPAGKATFYTWADPVGSRKLYWKCGKSHGEVTQKDDMMSPINMGDKKTIYLVSFFEGLQRIVLFTEDPKVFKVAYESEKAEIAEQEIVVALQNVGISLVNNYMKQEVAFIGITSSDIIWESKPKKKSRWKPLSIKQNEKLEKEFRDYTEPSPSEDKIIELEENIPVYLTPSGSNMKILRPNVIPLRRNYLPAIKVEYSTSEHQKAFRVQIFRIQIQNQINGAVFPFVFFPVKPPKTVALDSAPRPFAEVSIVMRSAGHSKIARIKYFKMLIQEMDLRLDLGFLFALADLFTEAEVTEKLEVELFRKDIEFFQEEFKTIQLTDTSQVSLYEYFHISPIKLHFSVSFRLGGEETVKDERQGRLIPVNSVNILLKSIGATLTDVQDVVFKLAFFELNYQFHTSPQLQYEVIKHYSKQAIRQMYVLLLGLDVLGNPYGLIRDFSEGVEAFFYEPYQGAIQGPEEFIEGMAIGLKALVGGAVGGLAGAASRITSAMAKGVAAITMDEDYQQKRRENMNTKPAGIREGITRGGKGLVTGFVSGITGLVTKPVKGAQKGGASGFFKGVGKGLVGAVARPTGGLIDMASSTFQGIKRATESYEDVESLRPPRFLDEDGVIRPFRLRDGTGNQILQKIQAYREWIKTHDSSSDDDN
ncbi:vacuolar protein sorting-associated protein 13A isoform X2 [Tachyglossus aculeatus]|uniref:vacuolar protein sorting-associated protein 13A isoform X2 n=1 Tax=Tachyglossus aculeatus TaxID=9261 RepID=UPI0018F7B74A|nr:vacuolar protein sorting-associated protein 13A isoform X2 [Tachyglossus aculeatus]